MKRPLSKSGSTAQRQAVIDAWQALQATPTLALYLPVIRASGSLKAGILLSQLIYWTRVGVNVPANDGWVYKLTRDMRHETGLSSIEQKTARFLLRDRCLIEEDRRGQGAHLAYRVQLPNLQKRLAEVLQMRFVPSELTLDTLRQHPGIYRRYFGERVGYHRDLVYLTDDVNAAVMLSIAFRQVVNNYNQHGYLLATLTIEEWQAVCGLSYKAQQRARAVLRDLGLIEESHRMASGRLFITINGELILHLLQTLKHPKYTIGIEKTLPIQLIAGFQNTVIQKTEYEENQTVINESNLGHWDCAKGKNQNRQKGKVGLYKRAKSESIKGQTLYKEVLDYRGFINYTSLAQTAHRRKAAQVGDGAETTAERLLPEALIWPKQFKTAERMTAVQMCVALLQTLDAETVQLLLDEIAGTVNLRSPLGLLKTLIDRSNQGMFYPSMAHRIQEARQLRERLAKLSEPGPSGHAKDARPSTPEVATASIGAIRDLLRRH